MLSRRWLICLKVKYNQSPSLFQPVNLGSSKWAAPVFPGIELILEEVLPRTWNLFRKFLSHFEFNHLIDKDKGSLYKNVHCTCGSFPPRLIHMQAIYNNPCNCVTKIPTSCHQSNSGKWQWCTGDIFGVWWDLHIAIMGHYNNISLF